ncbi:MAG: SusC/RagA family TonB-linked outer membrane protein [Paludibacter sp.]|nr:SusC/RagA family TonB-linked outer membrane protein [Paludibacter sp.]
MKYTNFKFKLRILSAFLMFVVSGVFVYGQNISISGVVKDVTTGEPIIGANILEKGTTNGTITNFDGEFSFSVTPKATLVVKYVGYQSVEIVVTGQKSIDVELKEDAIALGEVVAIGYGSQKKKEVTGSVASMKSEDFSSGVKTSPIGLVQGKVAGLNIIKTSSDPTNTGYNIQIRGFSTLDKGAGTSPLYIVDGIPVNNIDNISPDEIASMDILKDGSAAAIYGTRGTNGVIIITTKRGNNINGEARTIVEYSTYLSSSIRNGDMGMATASEFRNLATISGGKVIPTIYSDGSGVDYNTDWVSELTRTAAFTHNHNIAISGSAKNFNYRASLNYKNAEGIAKNSNREELISKLAASQKALDGWLELQYDFSFMHYRNDYFTGDFKQAAIVNPTYPIYDANTASGYFYIQGTGQANPVEGLQQKESYQDGNYFRGSVKAIINIKSVEGLRINAFGAMEKGDNYKYWYNDIINSDTDGSGKAGRTTDQNINKLFETTVDYSTQWGNHNLTSVAGISYQNFLYDGSDISNKGFPTSSSKYYQIGNGDASKDYLNASSYRNSNTLAAVFTRLNYNYNNKYLLSASIRREGSSRFGANNKWGWFPAASAGWRISSEEFMQNTKWCDDLKVRFGFGITGNNLASDLNSVAMLKNGGSFWYNKKYVYTYGVSQNQNEDLKWEKKYEYNLGVDYSLFKNRVFGSLEFYYRQTRDLLWEYEVPTPPYQFETLLANAGQMDSYGVELAVSLVPVKNKDWNWTTTPTISFNKNTITKLSDPSKGFNYKQTTSGSVGENGIMNTKTQLLMEGSPVGEFYGYKFAGWMTDGGTLTNDYNQSNGTWMFKTPAGGYTSDPTESQRMSLGSAQPWLTYGWNNMIRYKNIDLTLFFRGVLGNKVLNVTRWAYGPSASQSMNVFLKDAREGVLINKTYFSDYYLEDGSYIKLDNVSLGYSVPLKNNKYIQSLRLYTTAQNILTLTNYSGQDPEVNTTSVWDSGIDYPDFYPTVATFLIGCNITIN